MITWLLAALAAAALLFVLARNSDAYVRRVNAHWPPFGRFIDVEGARLHVVEAGAEDAPRLVLLHGASANLRELWNPLAPALTADHRVIAIDRPGYGHSTRGRGAEKLAVQARMIAAVLDAAGGGPAMFVAHSLAAAIVLRLALDRPDLVKGMVLIAPATHPYPGNNAWWARLSAAPLIGDLFCWLLIPWLGPSVGKGGVANNFKPGATPEGYYEDAGVGLIFRPRAFKASAKDVVATKRAFAAQAPSYPEIMAPAIIITGERDNVVSPKIHARALAADLPASELVTAPGAGHMPHRIRPDLVLAAIKRIDAMDAAVAEG
jgi:pimeloyl-ACP methyl ester carboxylesterase